jgi:O-antigen ligase
MTIHETTLSDTKLVGLNSSDFVDRAPLFVGLRPRSAVQSLWSPRLRGELSPKDTHHRGTENTEDAKRKTGKNFPHRLLDRTIFVALLGIIALTALPYGADGTRWETPFECIVYALGVLWLVEGLMRKSWRVSGLSLAIPVVGIILLALIQTIPMSARIVSADPYETRLFVFKLLALVLAGVLMNQYCSSNSRLRALIHTIIAIGMASALFGILRQTTQQSPGFILPALNPQEGYAQFINTNHFAFLMEMALGLVLGLLAGGAVRPDRVLIYLAMAVPMWLAVILSGSRGGILSIFAQLIFIGLLCGKVRPSEHRPEQMGDVLSWLWRISSSPVFRVVMTVVLLSVISFTILWVGGEPLSRRFQAIQVSGGVTSINEEAGTAEVIVRENTNRSDIWKATLRLIAANPVMGIGFGGYFAAIPEYHDASGVSVPRQAHNDYLELLASGGLIGGILGASFIFLLVRQSRRCLRSRDPFRRAACFGALAGLFAVAIHSFVDFGLHITINALVLTALAIIATVNLKVSQESGVGSQRL